MPLPYELLETEEETDVIGDIDKFIEYIESGQAEEDLKERLAIRHWELEQLF